MKTENCFQSVFFCVCFNKVKGTTCLIPRNHLDHLWVLLATKYLRGQLAVIELFFLNCFFFFVSVPMANKVKLVLK